MAAKGKAEREADVNTERWRRRLGIHHLGHQRAASACEPASSLFGRAEEGNSGAGEGGEGRRQEEEEEELHFPRSLAV